MKKFTAVIITVIMVISMCLTAYATNGFVQSPSSVLGPVLESGSNVNSECTGTIVVTSYAERHKLDEKSRKELEDAYDEIKNSSDVTDLNDVFAQYVKDKGLKSENLAVSDLFDIQYIDCDDHDEHGSFTITLKADNLENYVGLLRQYEGEWTFIDNGTVDGEYLTFTADDLCPFAIVVDNSGDSPQTGDNSNVLIWVMVLAASAGCLFLLFARKRKA